MLEKLRFKLPTMIASSLVFAFFFHVGSRVSSGERLDGNRGIMRLAAETLNDLAQTYGAAQVGYVIMALALGCGVATAVWIYRSPYL